MTGRAMHQAGPLSSAAALSLLCGGAIAGPGVPPSYGHDFVTVGAPGNRPVALSEMYYPQITPFFEPDLGRVDYTFRISRTEMTTRQWFDFVNVYWPIAEANGVARQDARFIGNYIGALNLNPQAPPQYVMATGTENIATSIGPVYAMRYINWLQAGRPTTNLTNAVFDHGAYDIATLTRQPGAQYWIPSLDEWTKAVHYDPNRYGAGQEGYWLYPGMSAIPLVGGPPGMPGSQTSAGGWVIPMQILPPDVGSYAAVATPWGLLDASGGEWEMTDTFSFGDPQRGFYSRGSSYRGNASEEDVVDFLLATTGGRNGFRIASAVPSPSSAALLCVGMSLAVTHGRRRVMT